MKSKYLSMLAAFLVVIGVLGISSMASASTLHDIVPGGLPTNNAQSAAKIVRERAESDPAVEAKLKEQSGSSSLSELKPAGYSNGAPPGSTNTGLTDSGGVSTAQETENCNIHSKMLVLINVHTSAKVYVCTKCSNLRLFGEPPPVFHPFSKRKVAPYYKKVSKKKKICGTWVTITVTIKGKIYARTWGKISGILNSRLKAAFKATVKIETKAKCSSTPCGCTPSSTPCGCSPPPTPTVTNPCQGFTISGATVSGTQCVVTVCGVSVVINGSNYGTIIIESSSCNSEKPPCGCEEHKEPPCKKCEEPKEPPKEEPKTLVVSWETIQEIYQKHKRPICVRVTPPSGAAVTFEAVDGELGNGGIGTYNAEANKFCVPYTAPAEEPTRVCVEPIAPSLPPGTKCDVATAIVSAPGAKTVVTTKEIPITQEPAWE